MSSEKKPQPVCLPDKFHQFAVTSSDYSRPFLAGCYPTLEAAVRAQGGKPEKWDVFVRYSTHEATIEALRAERDEARKFAEDMLYRKDAQFERAETAEARVAQLEAENSRLRDAAYNIWPYLRWTISDESPGHHPTMPSAVGAFAAAFNLPKEDERNRTRATLESRT